MTLLVVAAALAACQLIRPTPDLPQVPTATPKPPSIATSSPTPTVPPTPTRTPIPSVQPVLTQIPSVTPTVATAETPTPSRTPTPSLVLTPVVVAPYSTIDHPTLGRIRGQLSFPGEVVPPLAIYAAATDGSRFYRVDTSPVPPGKPVYEFPAIEPGSYHVTAHPMPNDAHRGGAYSYLSACEAGHVLEPAEGCWEDLQHVLAPVEVRAGQAVEEINILDWYDPMPSPPPDEIGSWPEYVNQQLSYRIQYPPHWEVRDVEQLVTTFGRSDVPEDIFASVRTTTGDIEELADQLITSLPRGEITSRQWRSFAGRESLRLVLDLPGGRFTWWFVPRFELVFILQAVTDSGQGSFDQMLESFEFEEK